MIKYQRLAILGASGHGKVVADLAEQLGYSVCFYDDVYPQKANIEHWPILGTFTDLLKLSCDDVYVFVAIGNNFIREQKLLLLIQRGFILPNLIHPTASVSQYAKISSASVVFANAVVNAFSVIGMGCIVNSSAVIEHDCMIGDFVHISPKAALAGGVRVGDKSWVGIGSQVKQLVSIGDKTLIGAGSTVLNDLPSDVVAYGSPAIVVGSNH